MSQCARQKAVERLRQTANALDRIGWKMLAKELRRVADVIESEVK